MRKIVFLLPLIAALLMGEYLDAQNIKNPNEFRIGIGDCYTESLFYHNSVHKDYSDLPITKTYVEDAGYHYLPHFFIEYYRTLRPWLSVGGQLDVGGFWWKRRTYQGGTNEVVDIENHNCQNICILPAVRFNWLDKGIFSCFSTVRAGIDINTGTEKNYLGQKTAVGFAIDPTYIGFGLGGEHWGGALELGSLFSIRSGNEVFLAASKLVSLSVSYKF